MGARRRGTTTRRTGRCWPHSASSSSSSSSMVPNASLIPHHEAQPECQRRNPDDDRRQDEDVRDRVGVDLTLGSVDQDRGRAADDLSHRDVQHEDDVWKMLSPDQLLHQVAPGDERVEADHHQDDDRPVVEVPERDHPVDPSATHEGVEDRQHGAEDGDQHTELHGHDSVVLTVRGIVCEDVVVEVVPT